MSKTKTTDRTDAVGVGPYRCAKGAELEAIELFFKDCPKLPPARPVAHVPGERRAKRVLPW